MRVVAWFAAKRGLPRAKHRGDHGPANEGSYDQHSNSAITEMKIQLYGHVRQPTN